VLAGLCFGGLVAFEATRVLRGRGLPPDRLVLIDALARLQPHGWIDWPLQAIEDWHRLSREAWRRAAVRWQARLRRDFLPDDRTLRAVRRVHERAEMRYRAKPQDVDLVLLRTADAGADRDLGWGTFVRSVEIVDIPSSHERFVDEDVDVTAEALRTVLEDLARA
jgi:thioesterase domain-containing protein